MELKQIAARRAVGLFTSIGLLNWPALASAAENVPHLDGRSLGLIWCLPFVGILLSIALCPLLAPHFWHRHFGKVSLFWALTFVIPCAAVYGIELALFEALHVLLLDYLPFIILILTLFVIAGGILISGTLRGSPATNTGILAFGTMIASLVGTTGAAMVLIRPLIRANAARVHKTHIFVFFIFLVANIGGSLTPLGDPPLFMGFLRGVDFMWTVEHMFLPALVSAALLILLFYGLDRRAWRRETEAVRGSNQSSNGALQVRGLSNILWLAVVIGAVLMSGIWDTDVAIPVWHLAYPIDWFIRDLILIGLVLLSIKTTKSSVRMENAFTWAPIQEVAILFFGIFLTIVPVLAILKAGTHGALAPLAALVSDTNGQPIPAAYFWLTGVLSAFLDNAPTYLVFFNLAGGDAQALMGPLQTTLLAISCGAVFMGAVTYIGNAPNFMVKAICEEQGVRMPSFFGYMAWSIACLMPIFVLLTWLFF
jgi:Na+/H+ antiporter NhaD/arsenite permease-like protein